MILIDFLEKHLSIESFFVVFAAAAKSSRAPRKVDNIQKDEYYSSFWIQLCELIIFFNCIRLLFIHRGELSSHHRMNILLSILN